MENFTSWFVGMQVVCICDDFGWSCTLGPYSVPTRVPMMGEVLTLSWIGPVEETGWIGVQFREIERRQADGPLSAEIFFKAAFFRPLSRGKTDISIFTKMLRGAARSRQKEETN